MNNQKGITIIETIIAMAIGVVVITLLMMIVTQGLGYIRKIQEQERLQANAIFVTDKMAYWVRQAKGFSSDEDLEDGSDCDSDGDKLCVVLRDDPEDADDLEAKIFEEDDINDNITFEGNHLISDGVKVTSLNFTALGHSIRVDFVLESKSGEVQLPITTTFAQRNL